MQKITQLARETIERLTQRIERESGDCPSHIVSENEHHIEDGGRYGTQDASGLPQWVLDEEKALRLRRRGH